VQIFVLLLICALIIAGIVFGNMLAKRRREALAALATRLGLSFDEEDDYALAERLEFLRAIDQGSNRYAYNRLSGVCQGYEVAAFDYHYETYSHSSKGGRQTHHHHLSILTLQLPRSFPELLVSPEGIFSKIAQAFGYDDIDFESAEFSRAFCVRSRDKKFAYDVCHPQMMEYLLAHRDLVIEIEEDVLALTFNSCLDATEIESRLQQMVDLRRLLPDYLLAETR
jgi:hypothetical protein